MAYKLFLPAEKQIKTGMQKSIVPFLCWKKIVQARDLNGNRWQHAIFFFIIHMKNTVLPAT